LGLELGKRLEDFERKRNFFAGEPASVPRRKGVASDTLCPVLHLGCWTSAGWRFPQGLHRRSAMFTEADAEIHALQGFLHEAKIAGPGALHFSSAVSGVEVLPQLSPVIPLGYSALVPVKGCHAHVGSNFYPALALGPSIHAESSRQTSPRFRKPRTRCGSWQRGGRICGLFGTRGCHAQSFHTAFGLGRAINPRRIVPTN